MQFISSLLKVKLVLLLILTTLTFSTQAQVKTITDNKLTIGMTGEQPPFNFVSINKEMVGYDVDAANYLAKEMNLELEIVVMPFAKLIPALKEGKLDIVMSGMAVTDKRKQDLLFSTPYALAGKSIVTTKKNLKHIRKTTGFNDSSIKLVALKGSTSAELGKKRLSKAQLTPVNHYEDGLIDVLSGKSDGLIADLAICELMVYRDTTNMLTLLKRPIAMEEIAIALSKNNEQLQREVNLHLLSLADKNGIEALHQKWFTKSDWLPLIP